MNALFYVFLSFLIYIAPSLLSEVVIRCLSSEFSLKYSELRPFISISLSAVFFIPLLIMVTPGDEKSKKIDFLNLGKTNARISMKILFISLCLWALSKYAGEFLNLKDEAAMLNATTLAGNAISMVTMFFAVCIAAPLIEECLFRGWLFKKLIYLNQHINVIISSAIFSLIHTQYEHVSTFISIFLVGLFLGYIRLLSGNLSYSILAHALYNFYSFCAICIIHFSSV